MTHIGTSRKLAVCLGKLHTMQSNVRQCLVQIIFSNILSNIRGSFQGFHAHTFFSPAYYFKILYHALTGRFYRYQIMSLSTKPQVSTPIQEADPNVTQSFLLQRNAFFFT